MGHPAGERQNRPVCLAGRASLWRESWIGETFIFGPIQMGIDPLPSLFDYASPQ